MPNTEKRIELYFGEGSSDKVYNSHVEEVDGGWQAVFEYGRRGQSLNEVRKPDHATTFGNAVLIQHTQIESKKKKGYQVTYEEDS